MIRSKSKKRPWWVDGGRERCGFCEQRYAYEVEYRCVSCDAAVCPHCVVVERTRKVVYCPSCPTDAGSE